VKALGVEARSGEFDQPDALGAAFDGLDRLLIIPTTDPAPVSARHAPRWSRR
jgi:uncharacterized protein YbjT (DUF2867 family)